MHQFMLVFVCLVDEIDEIFEKIEENEEKWESKVELCRCFGCWPL